MKLIPLNAAALRIGDPLPFSLRNAAGELIAAKGFVIDSRNALDGMAERGTKFYVDLYESEETNRAFMARLHSMVYKDASLSTIARAQVTRDDVDRSGYKGGRTSVFPDWLDLQGRADGLLGNPSREDFLRGVERLDAELTVLARRSPDALLFALFYLAANEIRTYSATHALLVHAIALIAAIEVLDWPAELVTTVGRAALTMNVSMTRLQDQLMRQSQPLTTAQKRLVDQHAHDSADILQRLGVSDPLWLEAVRLHHDKTPGPLQQRAPALRAARLIHRADIFSACLSPRVSRQPISAAAAMHASYFDEDKQVDEAGAALIKAVGVYSPGSFVRLFSDEVAVVIRRGMNTTTPHVAVLINRSGVPTVEPMIRDTSLSAFKIVSSVARREVKVKINLERMLALI